MEADTIPINVNHKPPPLDSDQLNYLVWRYLQEAGYAEAAVKLQRDWKADIRGLPFDKHIKDKALISLVQKGLRYHHLSLTVDENGQQTKNLVPSMFFFGPESAHAESASTQKEPLLKGTDLTRAASPASTVATTQKSRPRESTNAPEDLAPVAPKRGRKPAQSISADCNGVTVRKVSGTAEPEVANGAASHQPDVISPSVGDNTIEDGVMTNGNHEDRMDLDQNMQNVAEAADVVMEEQADDFPPLVPTLTNGESRAIQVVPAKIVNLGPTSAVLSLESAQTISRALWRPADAATLIAQGESSCDVWHLSGLDLHPNSVKPRPKSLLPAGEPGLLTAAAWDPNGFLLAVAIHAEQEGQIHLFDGQDLTLMEALPASQRAVTMLRWHASAFQLVGIAPFEENGVDGDPSTSTLLCWDMDQGKGATAPAVLTLPSAIFDIDSSKNSNDTSVYAAGDNTIYQCRGSTQLAIERQWTAASSNGREIFTFLRCASTGAAATVVIAAAASTASIWLPKQNIFKTACHQGDITGLEVRPSRRPTNGRYQVTEFATSSLDGSIKIWMYDESRVDILPIQTLRLNSSTPMMSLSYSPDGFCLAGASYTHARIWNAQHGYNDMASWEGVEPEWRGSSIKDDDSASAAGRSSLNGEGGSLYAEHSLTWHTDSKKLAFGLGSQVAIINFQR